MIIESLEIALDIIEQTREKGDVRTNTGHTGQKLGKVVAEMKDFIEYLKK